MMRCWWSFKEEELIEVYGVENVSKYIEYSEENGWVKM